MQKKDHKNALVCGSGGFIGNHLVNRLKKEGLLQTYKWIEE